MLKNLLLIVLCLVLFIKNNMVLGQQTRLFPTKKPTVIPTSRPTLSPETVEPTSDPTAGKVPPPKSMMIKFVSQRMLSTRESLQTRDVL